MNMSNPVTRRSFLKSSATGGGALMVGFVMPGLMLEATAKAGDAMPNSWVRISSDNAVTIQCARSEMGQGVYTSLPTLLAEELGVDITKISVEMAPAGEPYINAMVGGQLTGGSTSVREAYQRLRVAGAQARIVLIQAAAQKWGVAESACMAEDAHVFGPGGSKATYGELADAASKLTPPKEPALKSPKHFKYVGTPIKRFDTPQKVNGTAEYGIDVQAPGMMIATLAQSPVLGGKVKSFDASAAKNMPGVKDVVQISSGVAAVADTYWHARKALEAVKIDWVEGEAATQSTADIAAALRTAANEPGAPYKKIGDADAAMKTAATKVEAMYELSYVPHATMEPMNFFADVKADSCTLVGPTQFQQMAQGLVAGVLKMKPEQVSVRTTFLGGGFGRRVEVDFVVQAVEISKATGVPIKLVWSREDDMRNDVYRPAGAIKLSAGLDDNGSPVAWQYNHAGSSVTKRMFPAFVKDGVDPFMLEAALLPYDIPNQSGTVIIHDAIVPTGFWRSVSHNVNAFANESFIDEMAAAAGEDALEFRRKLLAKHPRFLRVLNKAAEMAGWGLIMPQGRALGIGVMEGYGTYLAQVAEVSVQGKEIKLHKMSIAADVGTMINPNIIDQQIESSLVYGMSSVLYDELAVEKGRVVQSNFHDYRVPRMPEMPEVDIHVFADGETPGGIGEPVTALVGPTIANAVHAITGKRLRKLPLKLT
jgi:isoquinoline 1-oxidoreductase subunit beta